MRLEKIALKNFGSYREATIDLSHVASAVVLGPNGAGKSTCFIDAILWALYGQARSSTDNMIRTGETDMMVAVEFSLSGQRYRVIRKRSIKTKAGKSDLELQVQQGGQSEEIGTVDVDWTPISGGRLAETQEKIVQLLNCDQDLLTATAFFLQGQADRFSRSTPSERKTILGSILRLDRYAILKQAASRQATRLEGRQSALQDQQNDVAATERLLAELQTQHQNARLTEIRERTSVEQHEAKRTEQIHAKAGLQARMDGMATLAQQHQQSNQRCHDLIREEHVLLDRHTRLQGILDGRGSIDVDRQTVLTIRSMIDSLEATRGELLQRQAERKGRLDGLGDTAQAYEQSRQRLPGITARLVALTDKQTRWEKILNNKATILQKVEDDKIARNSIAAIESATQERHTIIETVDQEITWALEQQRTMIEVEANLEMARREAQDAIQAYRRDTNEMQAALNRDQDQAVLLAQVPCGTDLQARCKFTRQAVEAQARIPGQVAAIRVRATETDQAIMALVASAIRDRITAHEKVVAELRETPWVEQIADARARKEQLRQAEQEGQRDLGRLRASLKDLERFTILKPELDLAEREIESVLEEMRAASAERAALDQTIMEQEAALREQTALVTELAQLNITITANELERRRHDTSIQSLTMAIGQATAQVEQAERDLPETARTLAITIEERTALQATLKSQELELLAADSIGTEISMTIGHLQNLEATITQAHQIIRGATTLVGNLAGRIQEAEQAIAAAKAIQEELDRLDRDLRHYRTLVDAYAIIPTLVMENALPILEQETNTLLGKISRTGMRVRFDTQKALKSRDGLAETLDITVRDQVGERPLENYSGGERFRLDLAQRIGLSKLLARRAGAKIETLAIDEGLGSLDEDGLNQLRECLGALGDDFKLVLVITHVDAMKATFPSQIMVTKDQQGSHVEVLA